MAYKDKDKQREADRIRQQRRRDAKKSKDVTIPGHDEGVTVAANVDSGGKVENVSVDHKPAIENYGQPNCQCKHCQQNRAQGSRHIINHGPYKKEAELKGRELNRVALPGDPDFTPHEQYGHSDTDKVVAAKKEENKLMAAMLTPDKYSRSRFDEAAVKAVDKLHRADSHAAVEGQTQPST